MPEDFSTTLRARCDTLYKFAAPFNQMGIEAMLYGDSNREPCHFHFMCRGENEPDVRRLLDGAYQILSGNTPVFVRAAPEITVSKDFCSDRMMALGNFRSSVARG